MGCSPTSSRWRDLERSRGVCVTPAASCPTDSTNGGAAEARDTQPDTGACGSVLSAVGRSDRRQGALDVRERRATNAQTPPDTTPRHANGAVKYSHARNGPSSLRMLNGMPAIIAPMNAAPTSTTAHPPRRIMTAPAKPGERDLYTSQTPPKTIEAGRITYSPASAKSTPADGPETAPIVTTASATTTTGPHQGRLGVTHRRTLFGSVTIRRPIEP